MVFNGHIQREHIFTIETRSYLTTAEIVSRSPSISFQSALHNALKPLKKKKLQKEKEKKYKLKKIILV